MDSKELSNKLKEQEQKLTPLLKKLDDLYNSIKNEMPNGAESWINEEVQEFIEFYSETTKSLGVDNLKKLKNKIDALISKLPSLVQREFNDKNNWPHYKKEEESKPYGWKTEEFHTYKVFRDVVSNIGTILDEFGYSLNKYGHVQIWQSLGNGKFRYSIGMGDRFLPKKIIQEYKDKLTEYLSLCDQINDTRSELSKAEAKDMWKKVN